jgi:hypothetical protein
MAVSLNRWTDPDSRVMIGRTELGPENMETKLKQIWFSYKLDLQLFLWFRPQTDISKIFAEIYGKQYYH